MPDAFLRKVIAQREAEQEAQVLRPLERARCLVCGVLVRLVEDATLKVCSACGGRKRQTRIERKAAESRWLLELVGIMDDQNTATVTGSFRVKCPTPGCPTLLRSNNTKGICGKCQTGSKAHLEGYVPDGSETPKLRVTTPKRTNADVRKKFRIVAEALGENPDAMIDKFCTAWLERLASRVSTTTSDLTEE